MSTNPPVTTAGTAVTLTEYEGWARATMLNPPVNLVDDVVYTELADAAERFAAEPATKVVILDSADPDFFAAHFDVSLSGDRLHAAYLANQRLIAALRSPNLISIAAIRGRARGGGNELALLCDMRFADETALFGQPEIGARMFPGGGALQLLPDLIGRSRALEMMTSGRDIDASTAELYGLVNRVVPAENLTRTVDGVAERISGFAHSPLTTIKAAVQRRHMPDSAELDHDSSAFVELMQSPETQQTIAGSLAAGLQTRGPLEYHLGS